MIRLTLIRRDRRESIVYVSPGVRLDRAQLAVVH